MVVSVCRVLGRPGITITVAPLLLDRLILLGQDLVVVDEEGRVRRLRFCCYCCFVIWPMTRARLSVFLYTYEYFYYTIIIIIAITITIITAEVVNVIDLGSSGGGGTVVSLPSAVVE